MYDYDASERPSPDHPFLPFQCVTASRTALEKSLSFNITEHFSVTV